ncbi:serine-rich adhesin for platelets-like isoform X2 [Dermacentor albipictus]|uniref:serine-rich adhesin for platelets-like isoform X2 n=1 Tax=Dermacentor albipictus TaxID=60249 RepID=UPI0031FBE7DB
MFDADARGAVSRQEGAGARGPAESSRLQSSVYTLRSYSNTAEERQECRSLSHLGILTPFYLLPLLFFGTRYGGCLYCLLLPLLLWSFNSLPKPGAALMHMVTVPLLGLMEPEQIALQYLSDQFVFIGHCHRGSRSPYGTVGLTSGCLSSAAASQVDALTMILLLSLVVAVDYWNDLALSLALDVSKRFGLRRGKLFAVLCSCCFVCASLFSGAVLSTTLLCLLNRVLTTMFEEDMDRPQDLVALPTSAIKGGSAQGSSQESSSLRSAMIAGNQALFERLTEVVLSMQKPVAMEQNAASTSEAGQASIAVVPKEPQEAKEGGFSAKRRFSQWRRRWSRKSSAIVPQEQVKALITDAGKTAVVDSTTEHATAEGGARPDEATAAQDVNLSADTGNQASTSGAPPALRTLVRVNLDEKGAFSPMTPFVVEKKVSLDEQRKLEAPYRFGASATNPDQSRANIRRVSQSILQSSFSKTQEPGTRSRTLNRLFGRNFSKSHPSSTRSGASNLVTKSRKRSKVLRSLSVIAGFFSRRFSETQPRLADEDGVHAHDQPAAARRSLADAKRHVVENEAKPDTDKLAAMDGPSAVGRVGTSAQYRAPYVGATLVTLSAQTDPGASKAPVVEPRPDVSTKDPSTTITGTVRATGNHGPPVAITKSSGSNLAVSATAAVTTPVLDTDAASASRELSCVRPAKPTREKRVSGGDTLTQGKKLQNGDPVTAKAEKVGNDQNTPVPSMREPSVSQECSSVRPTKRVGQKSATGGRTPLCGKKLQPGGLVTTKPDVQVGGDLKVENVARKSDEKPGFEETRKERREANEQMAVVTDTIATQDNFKSEGKGSRGVESLNTEVHHESHSNKDKSDASKKGNRSGKKSKGSTPSSRRQSSHPKSRASVCENSPESQTTPKHEGQTQSERSGPESYVKVGQQSVMRPSGAVSYENNEKPHSEDDNQAAPTLAKEAAQPSVRASDKTRHSLPEEGVEQKQVSSQSDSSKLSASTATEFERGAVRRKAGSSDGSVLRNSSRKSKAPARHDQSIDSPAAKGTAKERKQHANAYPDGKETQTEKLKPEEESRCKLHTNDTDKLPHPHEIAKALESTAVREDEKVLEAAKSNEPAKPASSSRTFVDQVHKSATSIRPLIDQQLQPVPIISSVSIRNARRASGTSVKTPRRKQSVVSFHTGTKEAALEFDPKHLPEEVPKAFAHLEEMGPKLSKKKSLSTILKASGSATTPRCEPLVDFGDTHFTLISPLLSPTRASHPRPLSSSSRLSRISTGSLSSLADSDAHSFGRQPITLRRMTRTRGYGFEDTTTRSADNRPSMLGSRIADQLASLRRKENVTSDRMDVHNAFLLGPSLMTMLGNICSFHAGGNRRALKIVSNAFEATGEGTGGTMNTSVWAIITLPGAVLALIICTTVIWFVHVRPHEPDPLSPENVAVMRAAQERSAARGKKRGVHCACAAYLVIFSLSYAPALLMNLELRTSMLVALSSVVLVTSALASCLQAAFEFLQHVWRMLPWGVVFMLGATQVASRLLQEHGLLTELFKLISTSFWEERSVVEVQAMLAFGASVLAETADKQAELKQIYPEYYAIPVIVGASSNFIMPASVPFAILHGLAQVPFLNLFFLGLFAKVVIIGMVIVTVSVVDQVGYLGSQTHAN